MKLQIPILLGALSIGAGVSQAQVQPAPPTFVPGGAPLDPRIEKSLRDGAANQLAPNPLGANVRRRELNDLLAARNQGQSPLFNIVLRGSLTPPPVNVQGMPPGSDVTFRVLLRSDVTFRVLPATNANPKGERLRVDIRRSDLKTVLETVAARANVRAVVDPELINSYYVEGGFEAKDAKGLLELIGGADVERWQSKSGTYFFAQKIGDASGNRGVFILPKTGELYVPRDFAPDATDPFVLKPQVVPLMPDKFAGESGVDPLFAMPIRPPVRPPIASPVNPYITPRFVEPRPRADEEAPQ